MTQNVVRRLVILNLILILFLSLTALLSAKEIAYARATDIIVPDQYSTIQAAIDHANGGDTIFVKAGTYYEHVVVNKAVALVGENRDNTIIDGSYMGVVVNATHDGIGISGFTVRKSGTAWNIGGPPYGAAIYMRNVTNCSVVGNKFTDDAAAVQLEFGADGNIIANNTMTSVTLGWGTFDASNNSFIGNNVTSNGRGLGLNVDSDNNVISGNRITATEWVIALHVCHYNNITGNYVANGQIGIYLPDSSYNRICHNQIINNVQQAGLQGFPSHTNYWDDGYPSGGNYWSDYHGTDSYHGPGQNRTGSDGIGDTFYAIDSLNIDHYPLISLFKQPVTLYVPTEYPTIQEAINNASNGDTVFVETGVYYEHVVVNKTISLVGENTETTIIDGSWTGTVVNITRSGVTVSNFTIQYSGTNPGVGGPPIGDAGIFMMNVEHCTISENIVVENAVGIQLEQGADSNTIVNNTVANNSLGVSIALAELNNVAQNRVDNNSLFSIGLPWAAENNTVSDNNVTSPGLCAIYIDGSHYNKLFRNIVANSSAGIWIFRSSSNRIYHNTFVNNVRQVNSTSPFGEPPLFNYWDDGYPSGGNYWSDYNGVDTHSGPYQNETGSDGKGDTPLVLDGNNADHYPLMKPWTEASNLIGDVNGDGRVDMRDVGYVARRFMCVLGDPLWDPNADLNNDGKINMVDIGTVARHFGESLP